MASGTPSPPKRALLVVDMQEDFCPPNGSLAVADGRSIAPLINALLASPAFSFRVATQDWHPSTHVSFFTNHLDENPDVKPFTSFTTLANPLNPNEKLESRLWPPHCVQDSPGAEIIPEIDLSNIDLRVKKGDKEDAEMYSAFCAPFQQPRHVYDTGLAKRLRDEGVSEVWVVGLATDYCVQSTAVDAVREGFVTYMIEEAAKAVDPNVWKDGGKVVCESSGVNIVSVKSPEVREGLGFTWGKD